MDGIDKFKATKEELVKEEIEQKMKEIRFLLEGIGIEFASFSLRLFVRNEGKITLEQVNSVLSVLENMASFGNTTGMNEFGELVSVLNGYREIEELTVLDKINGILDRAGIPE